MSRRRLCLAAALLIAGMLPSAPPAVGGELGYNDVDPFDIQMKIYEDAEAAVEMAEAALAGLRPTDDPLVMRRIAEVLSYLCEAHVELGQYLQAEAACLEAVATFDEVAKDDEVAEHYKSRLTLAPLFQTYEALGKYDKAIELAERELERTGDGGTDALKRITILTTIGNLNVGLGRWRAAETAYTRAIEQIEPLDLVRLWERRRQLPTLTYRNLAQLYWLEERFEKAEATLAVAMSTMESTFGRDHYYFPLFLEAQGWTYFHQGRYAEARHATGDALELHARQGDSENFVSLNAKALMVQIADAENADSSEAAGLLSSALTAPVDYDPGTYVGRRITILQEAARSELARHHLLTGNFLEAERLAREAAQALATFSGDSHYTATSYQLLAQTLYSQGRHEEAVVPARAAYAAQRTALPSYHSETGETLALMAQLYETLGAREELAATQTLLELHRAERAKFESGR